jgi:hypothetical protein
LFRIVPDPLGKAGISFPAIPALDALADGAGTHVARQVPVDFNNELIVPMLDPCAGPRRVRDYFEA